MTITSFVTPYGTYTFPTTTGDQSFKTNFANLVPKVNRMPGVSGGFDEYGFSRAPSEIGSVQFSIVLESDTRAGMQALRDALKTMAAWGKGRLIDTINGTPRWCYARVNNIEINEQRDRHTDLFQNVQLWFQVSDPYWYTTGTSTLWGGFTWGSGKWGGTTASTAISSSGTIAITNNGSADTLAKITIGNTSGSTVYDPIIRRIVNGAIADELAYTGSIATGSQLALNPNNHTALIDSVSVLSDLTFKHPQWMRLVPGANSLQVYVTGAVGVTVQYFERYV